MIRVYVLFSISRWKTTMIRDCLIPKAWIDWRSGRFLNHFSKCCIIEAGGATVVENSMAIWFPMENWPGLANPCSKKVSDPSCERAVILNHSPSSYEYRRSGSQRCQIFLQHFNHGGTTSRQKIILPQFTNLRQDWRRTRCRPRPRCARWSSGGKHYGCRRRCSTQLPDGTSRTVEWLRTRPAELKISKRTSWIYLSFNERMQAKAHSKDVANQRGRISKIFHGKYLKVKLFIF